MEGKRGTPQRADRLPIALRAESPRGEVGHDPFGGFLSLSARVALAVTGNPRPISSGGSGCRRGPFSGAARVSCREASPPPRTPLIWSDQPERARERERLRLKKNRLHESRARPPAVICAEAAGIDGLFLRGGDRRPRPGAQPEQGSVHGRELRGSGLPCPQRVSQRAVGLVLKKENTSCPEFEGSGCSEEGASLPTPCAPRLGGPTPRRRLARLHRAPAASADLRVSVDTAPAPAAPAAAGVPARASPGSRPRGSPRPDRARTQLGGTCRP
ncbi:translation initiation factor IF-2-like [Talpa occidentalis]|uniref:translation initiation factor IF-2-like n=1 Tax=Talpa occidentalis TaxID=50954 RepID=UPI00188DECB7|nr:translation initiation factor IF-2-like [Talpa occidentalis]